MYHDFDEIICFKFSKLGINMYNERIQKRNLRLEQSANSVDQLKSY
jgi:hypothetical protein